MAPLYHRYIPPTAAVDGPAPGTNKESPLDSQPVSKKRKRNDVSQPLSATDISGPEDDIVSIARANGSPDYHEHLDAEARPLQLSGEFAHVRSTKKRHRLEKEARKARKVAEKESKTHKRASSDGPADQGEVLDTTNLSAPARSPQDEPAPRSSPNAGRPVDDAQITKKEKRKPRPKERSTDDTVTEQSKAHLDKHQGILRKFETAQRNRPANQSQHSDAEQALDAPKPPPRPLEPFQIDLDDTDQPSKDSQLHDVHPTWLTQPIIAPQQVTVAFSQLNLAPSLVRRLSEMKLFTALPVQQAIIPLLLPAGRPGSDFPPGTQSDLPDIAVSAPTGSGKTLAYLLPMIECLKLYPSANRRLRGLVVVPTRELVLQVTKVAGDLAKDSDVRVGSASTTSKFKDEQQRLISTEQIFDTTEHARATQLVRDVDFPPKEDSAHFEPWLTRMRAITAEEVEEARVTVRGLSGHRFARHSAIDILICTPGRLLDHVKSTPGFSLAHVSFLVIDEADKLLDEQYGDFLDLLQRELTRPRTAREQDAREIFLRQHHLWDEATERQLRKVILSATMTHDVSQLAMLRLQRPKLVVVQHDEAKDSFKSTVVTAAQDGVEEQQDGFEQYQLPATLSEHCIPAGDGNEKPLYLLRLLELSILDRKAAAADQSSISDLDSRSDVSVDSSSVMSTSDSDSSPSDNDAMSVSSTNSFASQHSDKLPLRSNAHSRLNRRHEPPQEGRLAPTVLIFVASNEAAMRLSHLLKLLRPELAAHIVTWTKSTAKPDSKMQIDNTKPYLAISTDRAGRGLDTLAGRYISHVVQYDVPRSVVAYVHRVGRTARAGRRGHAWTLYTRPEARWFIKEVTRTASIQRSAAVERVKLSIDEGELRQRYEAALAGMKESLVTSSRA